MSVRSLSQSLSLSLSQSLALSLALSLSLSLTACKSADAGGATGDYSIEAAPVKAAANATVEAVVKFKPGAGLHWNEEFPARLRITDAGGLKADRDDFKMADFKSEAGTGAITIPLTAGAAGKATVKATADFSMCTAKECRIFKGIAVEVPVVVQ